VGGGWQGSGIRCLFDPWIQDPGWVESQKQLGSYFLELRNHFFLFFGG
jgi:hypothetical protein